MSLLRQPLSNPRLIEKRLRIEAIPPAHTQALHGWAGTLRDGSIVRQNDTPGCRFVLVSNMVEGLSIRSSGRLRVGCGRLSGIVAAAA